MPVDFIRKVVTIPSGTGRRSIQRTVKFPSTVLAAHVALDGFRLSYENGDHEVLTIEADTDFISKSGNAVTFRVECNLRDQNGDDPYSGYVTALVIAELA